MKSIVEEFKEKSTVIVQKVNVDSESDIAQEYGVRSIPCFIVLKDGEQVARKLGTQTLEQLKKLVE